MSFKSVFILLAAAGTGCGAVFLQPITDDKGRVPTAAKGNEASNASQNLANQRPGNKQTLAQIMKHEDDRMSGKVLWRNSKNHAAGSNCLCSFTQNKKKCARDNDDDSHCFLVCCIAGKTSDCKCDWVIASNQACQPSQNDGSECFASCCNDVAQDLQTYGPLAYPGAELLYPPGVPVPRNPFWAPEQPGEQPAVQPAAQQLYPAAQPATNMSQGYPAAPQVPQMVPTPYTGTQSSPAAYPQANMSQAGYPAYPGGYALNSMNTTSQRTSNGNTSEDVANNTQLVQHHHKNGQQHGHKRKHHKGKHS